RYHHPNVLLVIADQWGGRAADGSGRNQMLRLPAIRRLAAEGTVFTNAYSAFPVCSPARVSMFTGRMPSHFGIRGNFWKKSAVPLSIPTLGEIFAGAGYDVAYFGKDHTGGTALRGATEFGELTFSGAGMLAEGNLFDPVFTRSLINYLRAPRKRSFFATLSLINPHDICNVPKNDKSPCAGLYIGDATNQFQERYLRGEPLPPLPFNHRAPVPDWFWLKPHQGDENWWRKYLAVYYLLIENTDWLIATVLDELDRQGLRENTIVLFTSDHGDQMGAHQLTQKGVLFEEASRVPFILSAPGRVPENHRSHQLVSHIDILPTLCGLAGVKPPSASELAVDLAASLRGDHAPRRFLVTENAYARMLRMGHWKYIRAGGGKEILFNLAKDPGEGRDFMGEARGVADQALPLLRKWCRAAGDPFRI
ncbi:MAG: DUF229 domain-containing protein, partial [Lentisphaerae bacterium]